MATTDESPERADRQELVVADMLHELASVLGTDFDLPSVLGRLAARAEELLPIRAASVSLTSDPDTTWPTTISIPLRHDADGPGTLDLVPYPGTVLTPAEMTLARALGDVACSYVAAARTREEGASTTEPRARVVSEEGTPGDIVSTMLRNLLRIRSSKAAARLLQRTATGMGATLVPATEAGPDALPMDLALGEGPSILAEAEPLSAERLQLERILPRLVEDAQQAINLLRHNDRLEEASNSDPMTGLSNRRVLDGVMLSVSDGVVAMLDLDHFKLVNDNDGHAAGDQVLVAFGRLLAELTRAEDTSFRVGGEEFAIVAPGISIPDAVALIDRMRIAWLDRAPQPVTFSAGLAGIGPSGASEALLDADTALYRAKNSGRNRTEVGGAHDSNGGTDNAFQSAVD